MSDNPYSALDLPSLEAPAPRVFLITPNDDTTIPRVAKRLRIWNPETTAGAIVLHPKNNAAGSNVTLNVPPGLSYEHIICDQVLDTGTSASLVIHGYSD